METSTRGQLEIAIPTFNRSDRLRSQLRALFEIQASYDFKISVFDNGSTDLTSEVAAEYIGNPNFSYHRAQENGGISRNIIRCFEETTGAWVWTLSDDNPVRPEDLATISASIRSGRAEIYTFKVLGNHIAADAVYHDLRTFLSHQEFLTFGYLSATVYSRKAIDAGRHLLAPGAYSLLPHCVLACAALSKGFPIGCSTKSLCEPEDAEKRISRKEFALGALTCLEFFSEPRCLKLLAKQLRADTRWMLISALAQSATIEDALQWKRLCSIVNHTLSCSGAGLLSSIGKYSWHSRKDVRRELILLLLPFLPCWLLLALGKKLGLRTKQSKEIVVCDSKI